MSGKISVSYYALTEEQLRSIVSESVKATLAEVGFDFDVTRERLVSDPKSEHKPLAYWLKKLNIDRSTLWRREKEGLISPTRMGSKVFLCQNDVDEMFSKLSSRKSLGPEHISRSKKQPL